tara:strand:- start:41 stop:577 length:537 start_codon:yes stop_codon:yes gene_type:complete
MPMTFHANGLIEGFSGNSMPAGSVLQVQSVKDTSSTNLSQSGAYQWADISALTVNITPSATTSKILVLAHAVFSESYDYGIWFRVMRDSTPLTGATTGNRTPISFGNTTAGNYLDDKCVSSSFSYVDEPTSISQLTYKIQAISRYSPQTWSYNKSYDTGDSFANGQGVSTLTLLEVKG